MYQTNTQRADVNYFSSLFSRFSGFLNDFRARSYVETGAYKSSTKPVSYAKKQRRPFTPTVCKSCNASITFDTINKTRLRNAIGWIDTCDACAAEASVRS